MEIKGKQIINNGKKVPKWIFIGYFICIIAIIVSIISSENKQEKKPEAIDFSTEGALGLAENEYAYLEVQGITDAIAIYGNTNNVSDSDNDKYCIALNNGYWYVVDLDDDTMEKLNAIKEYTYSTDENAVQPETVKIYGMTENVSDELKQMLVDYYNEGEEKANKIEVSDFERYFGSVLLNVRKSPIDTTLENIVIMFAIVGFIILGIYNVCIFIIKDRMKKYLKQNDYEDILVEQLDDNVEEKHYKDKIIITKDFFVDLKSNGGLATFKFSDVKWVHIHNVKYYGVVTTSSSIIIHLKDGKTNINCVKIKGGTTDEFLEIFNKICEKVPTDCLKGYTKENQELFKEYKQEIKRCGL